MRTLVAELRRESDKVDAIIRRLQQGHSTISRRLEEMIDCLDNLESKITDRARNLKRELDEDREGGKQTPGAKKRKTRRSTYNYAI